ncbi:MAG TPA: restriction endonuclease subunit S [Rhizobiales bacterium]|nr:restriction endonuclease subunit S [Hyphomicrobiales bacterium]
MVKTGYKQTEVGEIPESWTVRPFEQTLKIANGQVNPREELYRDLILVAPDHIEGGTGRLIKRSTARDQGAISGKYLFKPGDIIYSKIRPYLKKIISVNFEGLCSADMYPLSPLGGVLGEYCFHLILGDRFTKFVESFSARSGIPKINREELSQFQCILPPPSEQKAIADALSDVDGLIGSLETLIAKKGDIKTATMQQLLTGKKRLPGFGEGKGTKQTELGELPEDWCLKTLGELFEITSSKRVFQHEWRTQGIPFYRARELAILGDTGSVENDLFIDLELYEKHRRSYGVPQKFDLLITGVGTLGKVYVVVDDHNFYFKDGNIIWLKSKGLINSEYLKQLFLTSLIERQINEFSAGSTVGTYTITGANKTQLPFPRLEEQEVISMMLSDMDFEIDELQNRLTKTKAIKQGMMQELLTGRTRLV